MKPTLHALIIGINDYDNTIKIDGRYAFGPLQGCVRDAETLHEWLQNDTSHELKATVLLDKAATKQAIVEAFQNQLSEADPGDQILIFYSGHGTVEHADRDVWTDETDGRLEGLACYYEQGDAGKFILADKELRYLLHSISKPDVHVVALFDCCHSGDNTRAAVEETFVKKQGLITFAQRNWSDFIFSDQFKREDFIGKKTAEVLPEGVYLQLAASESNEPAIESWIKQERHGVFAWYMMEVLRETGGHISYRDLCNRIRNRIRYKYGQRIKIYTPHGHIALQESGFLKKSLPDTATGFGTVDYNAENNEYRINRGIIDRLVSNQTRVFVTDSSGAQHQGVVGRADLTTAEVLFDGTTRSKLAQKAMNATLDGLASRPIRVCFVNQDLPDLEADALTQTLFAPENESFLLQESEASRADYLLTAAAGMYYLTKYSANLSSDFQPVTEPVFDETPDVAAQLIKQLQHIAQWHFTLELKNETATKIPTDLLRLEFFDEYGNPLPHENGVLPVKLTQSGTKDGRPQYKRPIRLKLTNIGTTDLYVAPILMMDFGCMVTLVTNPDSTRPIEPDNSEEFMFSPKNLTLIPLGLDETTRLFNVPFSSSILKFLISIEPITGIKNLDLDALPTMDALIERSRSRSLDQAKGQWDLNEQTQELPDGGWNALNIEIRTANPLYNRPDLEEINGYLNPETGSPYLAHFFTGLYFQKAESPSGALEIRSEVDSGLESDKGISFMGTLMAGANTWSNYWRNRRYDKMAKNYPDLPKMVSEGDSWFQHPLLDDIIDNISRMYPTYCTAAAGDTIRNWFAKGEYLKAVRSVQPRVLILSGGGNDILGDDLKKFLTMFTDGPEGENPARFFTPEFAKELDDIADIYRNIFEHFKTERPDMPILLHSYDYPRPKPANAGKSSNWLGQYFDKFNITRPADRTAAVKHMIDEFNRRLKKVASKYPDQVHYLDLRNQVRDGQWDDEIHPNNSGFQNVSGLFLRKISELLR